MPGTDVLMEDTVLAVMVDTDMAVMVDTVLDTVMVDTVARDPLMPMPMPGTDVVMEVMVDTAMVDMAVMEVTDMEVTDGASKYLTTPKKLRYKNMPFLLPKRVNTFYKKKTHQPLLFDKDY